MPSLLPLFGRVASREAFIGLAWGGMYVLPPWTGLDRLVSQATPTKRWVELPLLRHYTWLLAAI